MLTTEQVELRRQYTIDAFRYAHRSALTNARDTGLPCLKAFWLNQCAANRRAIAHHKAKAKA